MTVITNCDLWWDGVDHQSNVCSLFGKLILHWIVLFLRGNEKNVSKQRPLLMCLTSKAFPNHGQSYITMSGYLIKWYLYWPHSFYYSFLSITLDFNSYIQELYILNETHKALFYHFHCCILHRSNFLLAKPTFFNPYSLVSKVSKDPKEMD